ncbi:MAG TPA: SAF domain-containing protein [Acidimicrobiales bacterium]|nr:SAF domain-containing protein [Acidimicrobiales bacterium]
MTLEAGPELPGAPAVRVIGRRRPVVGGRAALGALLVALAAVGTFAAWSGATADHRVAYVVAAHALYPGERLSPADLTTTPMLLPTGLAERRAFRDPGRLVGATVVGPVGAGELVQASEVVTGVAALYADEVSFSIDAARAVDGTLQSGETVAVMATYGSSGDATTSLVVRAAHVVDVESASGTLGGQVTQTVTLGLDSVADALALVNAVNAGQVVLVREAAGGQSASAPYRSPSSAPQAGASASPGSTAGPGAGP